MRRRELLAVAAARGFVRLRDQAVDRLLRLIDARAEEPRATLLQVFV